MEGKTSKHQKDWEQRRYEIAKEALAAIICSPQPFSQPHEELAVQFADLLIEELKKSKK